MNLLNLIIKPIYAQICNPLLQDCTNVTAPKAYASNVVSTIISIFFIVAILYFIWHFIRGGYHMISSGGDPKKFEEARSQLTFALIGLIIIFTVFAVLKFVATVLGLQGIQDLTILWPQI